MARTEGRLRQQGGGGAARRGAAHQHPHLLLQLLLRVCSPGRTRHALLALRCLLGPAPARLSRQPGPVAGGGGAPQGSENQQGAAAGQFGCSGGGWACSPPALVHPSLPAHPHHSGSLLISNIAPLACFISSWASLGISRRSVSPASVNVCVGKGKRWGRDGGARHTLGKATVMRCRRAGPSRSHPQPASPPLPPIIRPVPPPLDHGAGALSQRANKYLRVQGTGNRLGRGLQRGIVGQMPVPIAFRGAGDKAQAEGAFDFSPLLSHPQQVIAGPGASFCTPA